jgi:hypothetical protein
MAQSARLRATTVYLQPRIARAMKLKAAISDRSVSQLINEVLLELLRQDEDDLRFAKRHRRDRARPLDTLLAEMKRDGEL